MVSMLVVLSLVTPVISGVPTLAAQSATAKMQGHVRDSAGVALVGAHVILLGTNHQALTDSTGAYTIEAIPPGSYNVESHANGRTTVRVNALTFAANQVVKQDFTMLLTRSTAPPPRR
jgi:hypothetical protein